MWRERCFENSLKNTFYLDNSASKYLIKKIVEKGKPIIDLACGPGMGLIPSVKQINPKHECIATDANKLLIMEWANVDDVLKVFELSNEEPWSIFTEKIDTWRERFIKNGFEIVYEEIFQQRKLNENDNDLGEMSQRFGIDLWLKETAFIVKLNGSEK